MEVNDDATHIIVGDININIPEGDDIMGTACKNAFNYGFRQMTHKISHV